MVQTSAGLTTRKDPKGPFTVLLYCKLNLKKAITEIIYSHTVNNSTLFLQQQCNIYKEIVL